MTRCAQEMCPNWSGDGDVCPCAIFDLPRPDHAERERLERHAEMNALVAGEFRRTYMEVAR
jgi:hypothetical protein